MQLSSGTETNLLQIFAKQTCQTPLLKCKSSCQEKRLHINSAITWHYSDTHLPPPPHRVEEPWNSSGVRFKKLRISIEIE